jgi:uncharacterized protein (TIGR03032 family)
MLSSERRSFAFEADPELARILRRLGSCLVVSTYRSGRVLVLRPTERDGELEQQGVDLPRPMGLAVEGGRLAVATREELVELETPVPGVAPEISRRHPTGAVDTHDVAFDGDDVIAVNTRFSTLDRLRDGAVEPLWRPEFVSERVPEDRCHLNGLALEDGAPTWVTALGATDEAGAWRGDRLGGGILIHVPSGETVLEGLAMPHSPRVFDRSVYFLVAARGEVCRADPVRRTWEVIARVPGFARGLARGGDHLFVGHSQVRWHHLFGDLPVAAGEHRAGVSALDLESGEIVAALRWVSDCEEIYDVQLAPLDAGGDVTPRAPRRRSGSADRRSGAPGAPR